MISANHMHSKSSAKPGLRAYKFRCRLPALLMLRPTNPGVAGNSDDRGYFFIEKFLEIQGFADLAALDHLFVK